ncbi:MAG: hypothetical protein COA79_11960 [Planctomycetota bacterium]|nr:MAG: hypothetical protein COA79_11960 [Planctomycetota bacterium]
MAKRLKLGLIGYGPYGQSLARSALNTTKIDVNMIYVYSEDEVPLVEANGFNATTNLNELLQSNDIEAVVIASPNALHKEHIIKACEAKKAIWAEKPLVLTLDDYDEVNAAIAKANVINHCNFSTRVGGIARKTLELARNGELGTLMHFISRSSRGVGLHSMGSAHKAVLTPELSGGWIMHHMCHQVDYSITLFNEKVKRVYAQSCRSTPDCPSEESISAILTFESGAIADLSDGLTPLGDHFFSVLGSKGAAHQNNGGLMFRNQLDDNDYGQGGHSTFFTPEAWSDDSMIAFYSVITGEPHGRNYELNIVPISEGRHVVEVELAIAESCKTGQVIQLS